MSNSDKSVKCNRNDDSIFDKYSKFYPELNKNAKVLKYSDFINLLSSEDLKHNDLIYLSKIASYIPLDIFKLLFIVSDSNDKGYVERQEFQKLSQQLIVHDHNHLLNKPSSDLDKDINKLVFLICKIYENNNNLKFNNSNSNIYNLNSPIFEKTFLNLVKNYNNTDMPYVTNFLNLSQNEKSNYKESNKDDDALLDFEKFSRLLDQLPKLKFDQSYSDMKNRNDNITPAQLKLIAQKIFYNKLPPLIADHLEIFAMNKFGNEINYNDSFKLIKMIRDLPKLNYLTFEKISNDKLHNSKFYLTSSSLYNYIHNLSKNNNLDSNENSITEDEILLYFNWNRYTYEHLKNHPSLDPSELLAILTDDMVVPNEVSYSDSPSNNFLHIFSSIHSFILGSFAGMIGASIVYPIDMIKTRMQNQKGNSLYTSYLDCFKKLIKNEGFLGLYSGLLPQIIGVAPEKAIKLTLNDLIRGFGKRQSLNGDITIGWEILAGSTAGLCQVVVTNPLEVSKIRLQTQGEYVRQLREQGKIINPKSALEVVRELGLKGLYRGAPACLLRDIPFSSIYFPTYANIKKGIFGLDPGKQGKRSNLEPWELLVSGALAGMPAAFLTTPCDVIKTRIQSKTNMGDIPYTGISDTFKRILREEGIRAFFKGGIARVCRSSPQFGFTLAAYELFQKALPLNLFYDTERPKSKSSSSAPSGLSLSEGSQRFTLSSSASSADMNPTLLALTNYYKSLETEKRK